jgi:hypothetical protein
MKLSPRPPRFALCCCVLALVAAAPAAHAAPGYTLIGWNNLGMHCMDPDYSVFALLPPYNTIAAQLIDADGRLVDAPQGITVTYEAVADPDGSRNRTSINKTNFWTYVAALFGVAPAPDVGLAGNAMPGAQNAPQPMDFDPVARWFIAEGIPITPHDDGGGINTYPLLRLVARDGGGAELAHTDIVLPVSEELNCRACHASGSSPAAQPFDGWVDDLDPERDTRLNILRLHDDLEGSTAAFQAALAAAGYEAGGLYATATAGTPILCARCHHSEALPGSGLPGISPLTQAIHTRMAGVRDPFTGLRLDDVHNREACYRCHPGSVTRCLRGAMGSAVAADGTLAMQCQSCHGTMRDVGSAARTGWLDEPTCQSCHTGTAVNNNGALRYTSVFEENGSVRQAVDATFATQPDTPLVGHSLYRFSTGHGGLQCEACHGATHAEYPSAARNDNLQNIALQGHAGMLAECTACHPATPRTVNGGPHGLHPLGQAWVERHGDAAERRLDDCRPCHGADLRGTALSRVQGDRTVTSDFGTKHFWRGFQVGCWNCHQGPGSENRNPNAPPVAADGTAATAAGVAVSIPLTASDADGDALSMRIVEQPRHGTVGLDGSTARYFPEAGFTGSDRFTFTASDGDSDGNLATVTIAVAAASCAGDCDASGVVTIDELVRGVDIALSGSGVGDCAAMDRSSDGAITVDELIAAVDAALSGCPGPAAARRAPAGAAA